MISIKAKRYLNISGAHDAKSGDVLFIDLSSGCCDIYLPEDCVAMDEITIYDVAKKIDQTHSINLLPGSKRINSQPITCFQIITGRSYTLVYINDSHGWHINATNKFVPNEKQPDGSIYCGIDSVHYYDKHINQLWSWGNNDYGQLNFGRVPYLDNPTLHHDDAYQYRYDFNGKTGVEYKGYGDTETVIFGDNKYTKKFNTNNDREFTEEKIYVKQPENIVKIQGSFEETLFELDNHTQYMYCDPDFNSGLFDTTATLTYGNFKKTIFNNIKTANGFAYYNLCQAMLRSDGTIYCCGDWNQTGTGPTSSSYVYTPTRLYDNGYYSELYSANMALKSDNTLWFWGYGTTPRFPIFAGNTYTLDGSYTYNLQSRFSPQIIKSFTSKPILVSPSSNVNVYDARYQTDIVCLNSDGTLEVWWWAANSSVSKLCHDKNTTQSFVSFAGAAPNFLTLDNNGYLYGGVIRDDITSQPGLQSLPRLSNKSFCEIHSDLYTLYAVDENGLVYGFSTNPFNENYNQSISLSLVTLNPKYKQSQYIGNLMYKDIHGCYRYINTQKLVCDEKLQEFNFPTIMAGDENIYTYDSDNNVLYAMGNPNNGQMFGETKSNCIASVNIDSDIKFKQFAMGTNHALALDNNGNVWAWGQNENGQLGDGTFINKSSPVKICEKKFIEIAAGAYHSLALDEVGTAYTWGSNCKGQLGQSELPEDNYEDIILWYNDVNNNYLDNQKDYIASLDKSILNQIWLNRPDNKTNYFRLLPGIYGYSDMRIGISMTSFPNNGLSDSDLYGILELCGSQNETDYYTTLLSLLCLYNQIALANNIDKRNFVLNNINDSTKEIFIEILIDIKNKKLSLIMDGVFKKDVNDQEYITLTFDYLMPFTSLFFTLNDEYKPKYKIHKIIASYNVKRDLYKLKDIDGYPGYKPKTLQNMIDNEDITLWWNCLEDTANFSKGFNDISMIC